MGSLKPNDLGLFDVQGNVFTWCQESYKSYPKTKNGEATEDKEDALSIEGTTSRVLRGGSFFALASNVRSAVRSNNVPTTRNFNVGVPSGEDFTAWLLYCFTPYRRRRSKMKMALNAYTPWGTWQTLEDTRSWSSSPRRMT